MKRLLVGITFLFLLNVNVYAQEFVGTAVIKSVTGTCAPYITVGNTFTARWEPKFGSRVNSSFALYSFASAQSYELPNAEFDTTARAVNYGKLYTTTRIISATSTDPAAAKVTFSSIVRIPAGVTTLPSTKFVSIESIITGYDRFTNPSGCDAKFNMTLTRIRPPPY